MFFLKIFFLVYMTQLCCTGGCLLIITKNAQNYNMEGNFFCRRLVKNPGTFK